MAELDRIKRNVKKMVGMGAPETDVDQYIASEGVTVDQVRAHKMSEYGSFAAGLEGAGQGISFGFSDEIEGAGRAVLNKVQDPNLSWGDAYDAGVKVPRDRQAHAQETNPYSYFGGMVAGGVAVPAGLAGLGVRAAGAAGGAARAGLGARSAKGAREGAAYGAAFGTGTAEGGLRDRATGAAQGAAAGAAGGAVIPGAVDVTSALFRGITAPIRGALSPGSFGRQKVAEAIARDKNPTGGLHRPTTSVTNDLSRIRSETGKDVRLMDMGGENTRNLVRTAANTASTGAQRLNRFLDQRQANQWRRIERDMVNGLGNPQTYSQNLQHVIERRGRRAQRDYNAAMRTETPMTNALQNVLTRPVFSGRNGQGGILRMATEALQNEGRTAGLQNRTEALHRVKMELDRQILAAKRAQRTGNSPPAGWDARTLTLAKRDLLDAMDNDAYKAANRAYSGESALISAAEDGFENALRMQTEEIAGVLRAMNPGEQAMWRMGAARALAQKIRSGNVNRDRTENLFSSPDIQIRMREIFPDQVSRRRFQRNLTVEARMADSRKAVQGNSSTAKQLAQADEARQPLAAAGAAANTAAGRLEPLLSYLGRQGNRFAGITPRSAEAIIDAAMLRDGSAASRALAKALTRAEAAPGRRAAWSKGVAGGWNAGGIGMMNAPGLHGGVGPRYEGGKLKPGQQR